MALSAERREELLRRVRPLAEDLTAHHSRRPDTPTLFGISGAQGTGKSTIAGLLKDELEACDLRVAVLSIDDLYLTRAERARLASEVHPLLATRGVPGTHDIALGASLFDRLRDAGPDTETQLPVFDKAVDDRSPTPRIFNGRPDVILFEGWCVGCRPQAGQDLQKPVNDLERESDGDGAWRRFVNDSLSDPYSAFFARLDRLLFLQAPDMDCVFHWRLQQEQDLAEQRAASGVAGTHIMDAAAVQRFIMHYERLTRWMFEDLPGRADTVFRFDEEHRLKN